MLMFIIGMAVGAVAILVAMTMYSVCAINGTEYREKEEAEYKKWIERENKLKDCFESKRCKK